MKFKSLEGFRRSKEKYAQLSAPENDMSATPQHLSGFGDMQQAAGNMAIRTLPQTEAIQSKSGIGQPANVYEKASPGCHCGGNCSECQTKQSVSIQRKADQRPNTTNISNASHQLHHFGSGQPLDSSTRGFFEPRFGREFSHVRVHTDAGASESASDIEARAYAAGPHIVFGEGQYRPDTPSGRQLLAHELTHVVQADAAASNPTRPSSSVNTLEREARQVAAAFPSGRIEPSISAVAQTPAVPLRQGPGDDLGAPTFGNLPGDDPQPAGLRRVKLLQKGGKWYEFAPGRTPATRTAKGAYDFVVMEGGDIWAVKSSSDLGHTEAARGQRVKWAGKIQFSNRGGLKQWTNASGHYVPSGEFARNAGLPLDQFHQSHHGPVVRPLSGDPRLPGKKEGPQLPVFQPKEEEILDPPRGTVQRPGSTERVKSGQIVSGEITTPSSPTTTAKVEGSKGVRPTSRIKGLKETLGRGSKWLGRGFKTVGRVVRKVLPALPVLSGVAEIAGHLSTFFSAKAQVEELKRQLDAMWAEYDAMIAELDATRNEASSDTEDTTAEAPYRHPPPDRGATGESDLVQSVQIYNLSRGRLTRKETRIPEDALKASYHRISFRSLTDADRSIYDIAPNQSDCQGVFRTGLSGIGRMYEFNGYAERRDYQKLSRLLQTQLKLLRLSCLMAGLSEGTLGPEKETPEPDGDRVTVRLDWIEGSVSESITATCEGPGTDGPWTHGADGALESLKQVTEDQDAETLPDYVLQVDYSRVTGGRTTNWSFSVTSWIDNPEHEAPEPTAIVEGELPEGACQASRYPNESVLAYVLKHYGYDCR